MAARILIVEDNPANLELMTYLLNAAAHRVFAAETGREGLEVASSERPDLIICDVLLPDIDGYEVARWLKSHPDLRAIPLVAVTALAMVGDRNRVLAAGFDAYVPKPIAPEIFVRQMEAFLPPGMRRVARRPAAADWTPIPQTASCGETILVVDHLPVNLELARRILEPSGYRVITAGAMMEGLASARTNSCELILSDICMSDESGYDFLRTAKNDPVLRLVPFVLITSTAIGEKACAKGLALGAARFLCRPIEPELLLKEIRACLLEREIG
jgi:two-component system cell cycle response regulator